MRNEQVHDAFHAALNVFTPNVTPPERCTHHTWVLVEGGGERCECGATRVSTPRVDPQAPWSVRAQVRALHNRPDVRHRCEACGNRVDLRPILVLNIQRRMINALEAQLRAAGIEPNAEFPLPKRDTRTEYERTHAVPNRDND